MNYPDLLLIIALLYGAYRGFVKGFLMEISFLLALIAGVWGAMKFSAKASVFLKEKFQFSEGILHAISFSIVFIATVVIILITAKIVEKLLDISALGIFNKLAGAFLGILKWTFLMVILIYFFMPLNKRFHFFTADQITQSYLFEHLNAFSNYIVPLMKGVVTEKANVLIK